MIDGCAVYFYLLIYMPFSELGSFVALACDVSSELKYALGYYSVSLLHYDTALVMYYLEVRRICPHM